MIIVILMVKEKLENFIHIFAVPWCCILPLALALFGLAGGTVGIFLSKFTPLFLIISIVLIGYANYNVWFGKFKTLKHRIYVSLITIIAIVLWIWSFSRMGWI